jgi:hypothetical protein
MKKAMLVMALVLVAAAVALAQPGYAPSSDVLGAHLVYGRGCVACHSPHSGARGNGLTTTDATSGDSALWGANLQPFYNQSFAFGDNGAYVYTAPASQVAHDALTGIMECLSCHDGNLAPNGMMKGSTVETIPNANGGNSPTLLGNDGGTKGDYKNDHPVGQLAIVGCGGTYDWDCAIDSTGKITAPAGSKFAQFQLNYGWTVRTSAYNAQPMVTCTTCHDQHSMNSYAGKIAGTQSTWKTMFFVRGYYNPGNSASNSAAQFCRQCHGGESNEMHGAMNIPTI